jgi:hypothetical protein
MPEQSRLGTRRTTTKVDGGSLHRAPDPKDRPACLEAGLGGIEPRFEPMHTALNATAARVAFHDLADAWEQCYDAVVRLWKNAREEAA